MYLCRKPSNYEGRRRASLMRPIKTLSPWMGYLSRGNASMPFIHQTKSEGMSDYYSILSLHLTTPPSQRANQTLSFLSTRMSIELGVTIAKALLENV